MEQAQVVGGPQRQSLSPLKCKAAEAAAELLPNQTSLFFTDNGMRAVNGRLCGRKDKKKKHLIVGKIITRLLLLVCFLLNVDAQPVTGAMYFFKMNNAISQKMRN